MLGVGRQHLARCFLAVRFEYLGGPDLDGDAIDLAAGAGKWIEGADFQAQFQRRLAEIERRLVLGDFCRVSDARFRLRHGFERLLLHLAQGLDDHLAAQGGQFVVQAGGGIARFDGRALDGQHGARIEAFFHLHDGHARFIVARLDGAVDRCGTAPARQQGTVDIDAGFDVERAARQDQAVGRHHHHVVVGGQQALVGRLCLGGALRVLAVHAQGQGLQHLDAMLLRILLDGRGVQLHAASGRAVGLGQHQRNVEARFVQVFQGRGGEFRRACEDHFHMVP